MDNTGSAARTPEGENFVPGQGQESGFESVGSVEFAGENSHEGREQENPLNTEQAPAQEEKQTGANASSGASATDVPDPAEEVKQAFEAETSDIYVDDTDNIVTPKVEALVQKAKNLNSPRKMQVAMTVIKEKVQKGIIDKSNIN